MGKRVFLVRFSVIALSLFSISWAQAQSFSEGDSSITASQGQSWYSRYTENLRFSFFNFTSAPFIQANEMAAQMRSYNYFAIDYRLGRGKKVSFRPVFEFVTAGTNNRDEYSEGRIWWGATYINYVDRNFALLPYDVDMQAEWRLYAASPEAAREKGTIARFRPKFSFERRLIRQLALVLEVEPDYYFQSRAASLNSRGRAQGNNHFGYESSLGLEYQFDRTFSVQGSVSHDQAWSHRSPENGINEAFRKEDIGLGTGLGMSLGRIFLIAGISQKHNVSKPIRGFRPFHPEETEYYLLNNWVF